MDWPTAKINFKKTTEKHYIRHNAETTLLAGYSYSVIKKWCQGLIFKELVCKFGGKLHWICYCVKGLRIRNYSSPYFHAFVLNTHQNNSKYGHFSSTKNRLVLIFCLRISRISNDAVMIMIMKLVIVQ